MPGGITGTNVSFFKHYFIFTYLVGVGVHAMMWVWRPEDNL